MSHALHAAAGDPTWRVAGLLAGLALLFFSPALLDGRVLAPPGDGTLYYYPMRAHVAEVLSRGELPLWNPYLYSGFPLLADNEAGVFYPPNWLFLLLPAPLAMNLVVVSSYFLAAFFTYLYARAIGATLLGGLLAGVVFGASGFMVAHVAHATIINGAAWLPLLLYFVERLRRRAGWVELAGGALTLAVQVFAGHPQIAVYSALTAGLYALFFVLGEPPAVGRRRFLTASAALVLVGLLLAACQIVPTLELARVSNRASLSYGAFSDPSLPPSHLVLFLSPYAFGGGPAGRYAFSWMGLGLSESTGYVGLLTLILALAALALLGRNRHARFFWLLAVLGLLMALGEHTPLHGVLYGLPGYNLFRAPARNLMQVDLALAVLAGLAASQLPQVQRATRRAAGTLAAASLALGVLLARAEPGFTGLLDPRAPAPASLASLQPERRFLHGAIALALVSALAAVHLVRRQDRRAKALAFLVLLTDLGLFGPLWYRPFACPTAAALSPASPLLDQLERFGARPRETRFLSLNPEESEEDFARNEPNTSILRRTPTAGGSSSFILDRYSEMVSWTDFAVGVDLSRAGRALDVLGVRHLVVSERLLSPPPTVSVEGIGLTASEMGLKLARDRRSSAELALPSLRCSAIAVDATVVSGATREGDPLVRISAWTAAGERLSAVLNAGAGAIPWAGPPPAAPTHRLLWELGAPREIRRVRLEDLAEADALRIGRVTLHDAPTGHTLVLGGGEAPLAHLRPVPHRIEVAVAAEPASAIVFTSSISGPTTLSQGQPMAKVTVRTAEGRAIQRFLLAGEHTSEWAWERPDVRPVIKHRMAPVAETFPAEGGFPGHRYRGRVELGGRHRVESVAVEHVGPDSSLYLARVELLDDRTAKTTPLPLEAVELQPESTTGPGPRELRLGLPPLAASAIEIVSALHDSTFVHQGQPVARVSVRTEGGSIAALLRAGEDTAEWAWDRPDVSARVRHGKARVAESFPVPGADHEGHRYAARIDLGGRRRVEEIRVSSLAPVVRLEIRRLVFEDPEGAGTWSLPVQGLPLTLTRDETRPAVAFEPPSVPCTEVAVASRLARSVEVRQGEPVARLAAVAADGRVFETLLRAGEDTSEWQAAREDVRGRLKHREAPVAFTGALWPQRGLWFLSRMGLDDRLRLRRVVVEAVHPDAVVTLGGLSLHDEQTGASTPLSLVRAQIAAEPRWRRLFAAMGVVAYENAEALARAWLVPRVRSLPAPDVLEAVRTGRFADGTPFEPRRVALVEEGPEADFGPLDPAARADIVHESSNLLVVATGSRTASLLVLADAAYPGWRAKVDGTPAPILRTDYALRGVALPPGDHRVELEYRPASFRFGAATSTLALAGLVLAAPLPRRRAWRLLAALALLSIAAGVVAWGSSAGSPRGEGAGPPPPREASEPAHRVVPLAGLRDDELGPGWGPAEAWAMGSAGRWTSPEALLRLPRPEGAGGLAVELTLDNPGGWTAGRIDVNGRTLRRLEGGNGRRREILDLRGLAGTTQELRIVVETPFRSTERPVGRLQGVFVHSVQLLEAPVASELDLGAAEDGRPELASGWWGRESWPDSPGGRWTREEARLLLERREDENGLFVDMSFDHPSQITTGRIEAGGRVLRAFRGGNGRHTTVVDIGSVEGRAIPVRLVAERPFAPREYDQASQDSRRLGIFVHSVRLIRLPLAGATP